LAGSGFIYIFTGGLLLPKSYTKQTLGRYEMNAEILSVGTELLMGQIANTDAQFLSRELNALGISVYHHTVVGDNPARLKQALELALSRADAVLLTGGLGPTEDDLTKETVAEYLGLPMEPDADSLRELEAFFGRLGRAMTPNNAKQGWFPKGSLILENPNGTAPGCIVKAKNQTIVILPGPPRELQPMYLNHVKPYLEGLSDAVITSKMLHVFGVGESEATYRLRDLIEGQTNPTIASYVGAGDIILRVTARVKRGEDPSALLDPVVNTICERLYPCVFSTDDMDLPQVVVKLLRERKQTLAIAESCTGGMMASMLVAVPGVSEALLEALVTYSNQSKQTRLGVSPETLETYGAVSAETAKEMACGVRETLHADFGLSSTGIAGPGGGTEDKPVGLVYLALSDEKGCHVLELRQRRDREMNRRGASLNALELLRCALLGIDQ
jgi:nicotinamide-nucleotide amidase